MPVPHHRSVIWSHLLAAVSACSRQVPASKHRILVIFPKKTFGITIIKSQLCGNRVLHANFVSVYCPPWSAPRRAEASHSSRETRPQPAPARPPFTRAAARHGRRETVPVLHPKGRPRNYLRSAKKRTTATRRRRSEVVPPKPHTRDARTPPPPWPQGAARLLHRRATPPRAPAIPAAPRPPARPSRAAPAPSPSPGHTGT